MEVKLSCKRCEHNWNYTGKKGKASYPEYTGCPKCKTSVKVEK